MSEARRMHEKTHHTKRATPLALIWARWMPRGDPVVVYGVLVGAADLRKR